MSSGKKLNIAIVGAGGRGGAFGRMLESLGGRIEAICDTQPDKLAAWARDGGKPRAFSDYQQMLETADLDAVILDTPMPFHVPQSVAALQRGLHVLCEVPAGVSIDECRALTLAARQAKAVYMMAENYLYTRPNQIVRQIARAGLFGELYYAEGEYIHELKQLNEQTPWRRQWQTGIEGNTYPTHSLGPILSWMEGDRVVQVCCVGTGHHYRDPRGRPYHSDSTVTLCKTAKGALIKLRLDMLSDRPHAMANYQLQGTDGCYESSRDGLGERNKIWLRSLGTEPRWFDLDELVSRDELSRSFVPQDWREAPAEAINSGHGGSDWFVARDFLLAAGGQIPSPIDVDRAMDFTLPGLVSQQSILCGGAWLDVPDSRQWQPGLAKGQLHMLWPEARLGQWPEVRLAPEYELRSYRNPDTDPILELMRRVKLADWNATALAQIHESVLPNGHFVVIHRPTRRVVASAMAHHHPTKLHPGGGEVGWVAADPDHARKGLGAAVTAAATTRLIRAGYHRIYLRTDDHRLPAIAIYLRLGFEPFMYAPDMPKRWQAIREKLQARSKDATKS